MLETSLRKLRADAEPFQTRRQRAPSDATGDLSFEAVTFGGDEQEVARPSKPTVPSNSVEPSNTIAIKNLPLDIQLEELQQALNKFEPLPKDIMLHRDSHGVFRGVAFAEFANVAAAQRAFSVYSDRLQLGQKLRVEYRRATPQSQSDVSAGVQSERAETVSHRGRIRAESVGHRGETKSRGDISHNSNSPFKDLFIPRDEGGKQLLEKMTAFKQDHEQSELAFPPTLTLHQRKMVHHIAYNLHLFHFSVGEGDNRYITVSKRPVQIAGKPSHRPHGTAISIPSSRAAPSRGQQVPSLSKSAPSTSHDLLQPIVFRSQAFRREMPHAPLQRHARVPDGSRGFAIGRGRPLSSTLCEGSPGALSKPQHHL